MLLGREDSLRSNNYTCVCVCGMRCFPFPLLFLPATGSDTKQTGLFSLLGNVSRSYFCPYFARSCLCVYTKMKFFRRCLLKHCFLYLFPRPWRLLQRLAFLSQFVSAQSVRSIKWRSHHHATVNLDCGEMRERESFSFLVSSQFIWVSFLRFYSAHRRILPPLFIQVSFPLSLSPLSARQVTGRFRFWISNSLSSCCFLFVRSRKRDGGLVSLSLFQGKQHLPHPLARGYITMPTCVYGCTFESLVRTCVRTHACTSLRFLAFACLSRITFSFSSSHDTFRFFLAIWASAYCWCNIHKCGFFL